MPSLGSLTQALTQTLLTEGVAVLSPKARASGKQRTQGIPAGGKGAPSGAPRKKPRVEGKSLHDILGESLAVLRGR